MSRRKIHCFVASVVSHAALLFLLIGSSGFAPHNPDPVPPVIVNFIPDKLIAAPLVGGGNPNAPISTLTAPPPKKTEVKKPEPESAPAPQPKAPPAKEPSVQTDQRKRSPRKIEISKVPVVRNDAAAPAPKRNTAEREAAIAAARAAADARRRAEQRRALIGSAAEKLQSNLSDRTVVPESFGPGGGGPTYAGYDLYVVSLYQRAFQPPLEVADESVTTRVRIVIARDGTVVDARIVAPSGVAALDRAVQAALDRVTAIGEPLPDEIKGDRHTIVIRFNLKTKKLFG